MEIIETIIPGVKLIKRKPVKDERGSFQRLFCQEELVSLMLGEKIEQINYSKTTTKGTLRGLHLQLGDFAEKKIITCTKGAVFDLALDLRKNSETFLEHFSLELSQEEHLSILIPEGVAHGFQSLQDNSELLYLHTSRYSFSHETGIYPLDPTLNLEWPLKAIKLSERDKSLKVVDENF